MGRTMVPKSLPIPILILKSRIENPNLTLPGLGPLFGILSVLCMNPCCVPYG